MASLKKRGKYYYVRFVKYDNGHRFEKTYSLGTRWKEIAEKQKNELSRLEDAYKIDPFDPHFSIETALSAKSGPETIPLINNAAQQWLQIKSKLSSQTYKTYKHRIEKFINESECGNMEVYKINATMVEKYIFREGIEAPTVRSDAKHLSVFFNWLVKKGWLKVNPVDEIKLPDKTSNYHDKMLTKDEFNRILKKFDSFKSEYMKKPMARDFHRQEWFKPMLACFFYGGFRLHEIGYSYEIDYSGLKYISLQKLKGFIWVPPGKGKKERYVPISKHLQPFIDHYIDQAVDHNANDYVFTHPSGPYAGKAVTGKAFRDAFNEYCKKAEVPESRIPHGLRHQRITQWIEDGFSVKEASMMGGHSSTAVTESIYTHLEFEKIKEKMKRLEK